MKKWLVLYNGWLGMFFLRKASTVSIKQMYLKGIGLVGGFLKNDVTFEIEWSDRKDNSFFSTGNQPFT